MERNYIQNRMINVYMTIKKAIYQLKQKARKTMTVTSVFYMILCVDISC